MPSCSLGSLTAWSKSLSADLVRATRFHHLRQLPLWSDFLLAFPEEEDSPIHRVFYCPKTTTLEIILDCLSNHVEVRKEDAALHFTFDDEVEYTDKAFLILPRWDSPSVFSYALESPLLETYLYDAQEWKHNNVGSPLRVCVPKEEFVVIKRKLSNVKFNRITQEILPLLKRNCSHAHRVDFANLLRLACCEWLVSLFFSEETEGEIESDRIMSRLVNAMSLLLPVFDTPEYCCELLKWTLQQNELRFPGKHPDIRSILLQELGELLPVMEKPPVYLASIDLDMQRLDSSAEVVDEELVKTILGNLQIVTTCFHDRHELEQEFLATTKIVELYRRFPHVTPICEKRIDFHCVALLAQKLFFRFRKARTPKQLTFRQTIRYSLVQEERDYLTVGVVALRTSLALDAEPDVKVTSRERFLLGELLVDLELYDEAEENLLVVLQEIVPRCNWQELDAKDVLTRLAVVNQKKLEFAKAVNYYELAIQSVSQQYGARIPVCLCTETTRLLTDLEDLHEDCIFYLERMRDTLVRRIPEMMQQFGESTTGSGYDLKTKLETDFCCSESEDTVLSSSASGMFFDPNNNKDEETEEEDFWESRSRSECGTILEEDEDEVDSEKQQKEEEEDMEAMLANLNRFPHPPPNWQGQYPIAHADTEHEQVLRYIEGLNTVYRLIPFNVQRRNQVKADNLDVSRKLNLQSIRRKRLAQILPGFNRAFAEQNFRFILDFSEELADLQVEADCVLDSLHAQEKVLHAKFHCSLGLPWEEYDKLAQNFCRNLAFDDGLRVCNTFLTLAPNEGNAENRARALARLATVYEAKGSIDEALRFYEQSEAIFPLPQCQVDVLSVAQARFALLARLPHTDFLFDALYQVGKKVEGMLQNHDGETRSLFYEKFARVLLDYDELEEAEIYCLHVVELLGEGSSRRRHLSLWQLRITISNRQNDYALSEQCALLALNLIPQDEKEAFNVFVLLPIWLNRAKECISEKERDDDEDEEEEEENEDDEDEEVFIDKVLDHCDLALRRTDNDGARVHYYMLKGEALFLKKMFLPAHQQYSLAESVFASRNEVNPLLTEKMEELRIAFERANEYDEDDDEDQDDDHHTSSEEVISSSNEEDDDDDDDDDGDEEEEFDEPSPPVLMAKPRLGGLLLKRNISQVLEE